MTHAHIDYSRRRLPGDTGSTLCGDQGSGFPQSHQEDDDCYRERAFQESEAILNETSGRSAMRMDRCLLQCLCGLHLSPMRMTYFTRKSFRD